VTEAIPNQAERSIELTSEVNESEVPIFQFEHSGIVVPDLDVAVEFYVSAFGFVPVVVDSESVDIEPSAVAVASGPLRVRAAYLSAGPAFIELHEFAPSVATQRSVPNLGFGHISLSVLDIRRACQHLRPFGMTFYSEPNYVEGGGMAGRWWVYGQDPWGNVIELAQPASKS